MNRILSVAKLGHPILRRKAKEVSRIDDCVKDFIEDMSFTLKHSEGMGIAAPQLYKSLAIIIVSSRPSKNYPDAPTMKPIVMINPKIIGKDNQTNNDWEGCMSVPGIRAKITRLSNIYVEYLTTNGEKKRKSFNCFIARIIQHEADHLQGLVFLDRVKSTKDIISDEEFQKIMNESRAK